MTKLFINILQLYQYWFSPDHSFWGRQKFPHGYCRFYPSCSQYAKETLETKGLMGMGKIMRRILRCNPYSKGGVDVP